MHDFVHAIHVVHDVHVTESIANVIHDLTVGNACTAQSHWTGRKRIL